MMEKTLTSPSGAAKAVAEVFQRDARCKVSVREDRAFNAGEFVFFGDIELFPSDRNDPEQVLRAVKHGEFEWRTPALAEITANLHEQLGIDALGADAKERATDKVRRICNSLGAIAVRSGP